MASSNLHTYGVKHCVLIDGDCGRFELFSNVHPYTLNRLAQSNDFPAFYLHAIAGSLVMGDHGTSLDYHICYNALDKETDDYYQVLARKYSQNVRLYASMEPEGVGACMKLMADKYKNEYNCLWVIHGTENCYQELIAHLNADSSAIVANYSWTQNLKRGSNRIEYLFTDVAPKVLDAQLKNCGTKSFPLYVTQPTPLAATTSKQEKSSEKPKDVRSFICERDKCGKSFSSKKQLNRHVVREHPIQIALHDPNPHTEQLIENQNSTIPPLSQPPAPPPPQPSPSPGKATKKPKVKSFTCDKDNCRKSFSSIKQLSRHRDKEHPVIIQLQETQPSVNEEIDDEHPSKPKVTSPEEMQYSDQHRRLPQGP
ncbi:unnamed protein product [Didymodactylos carnosus]|uniref:C2H2-type domain-containing protein n=1 Tax=Didymodactylos carnosus TaxID=1234261 RepID=A0A814TC91_9BILA|nr:unnamed protein product [Didymodactylos carnosus]CAF3922278.1 unnamed protein product [Didymodactylos carnosus]